MNDFEPRAIALYPGGSVSTLLGSVSGMIVRGTEMEGLSTQQVHPACFMLTLSTYLLLIKVELVAGGINFFMKISYSSLIFPFLLF